MSGRAAGGGGAAHLGVTPPSEAAMLDHLGIPVRDFDRSIAFYEKVLAPLGYSVVMRVGPEDGAAGRHVGFGAGKPSFWLSEAGEAAGHLHIAFAAADRAAVAAFHAAALAAGAADNGGPGLRPHYHPNYYGAFVIDPDGHNVEAVCHAPE